MYSLRDNFQKFNFSVSNQIGISYTIKINYISILYNLLNCNCVSCQDNPPLSPKSIKFKNIPFFLTYF